MGEQGAVHTYAFFSFFSSLVFCVFGLRKEMRNGKRGAEGGGVVCEMEWRTRKAMKAIQVWRINSGDEKK